MPDAIAPLNRTPGVSSLTRIEPRRPQAKGDAADFRGLMSGLLADVNRVQHEASDAIASFAAGNGDNLHEVMLAVSKADVSFQFLMETRNKLVDAYHEVMRMQL